MAFAALVLGAMASGCAGRKTTLDGDAGTASDQAAAGQGTTAASSTAQPASTQPTSTGPSSTDPSISGSSPSAVSPRAAADAFWAGRGHPDTARLALTAYLNASQLPGADAALFARLSRSYYLVANYVETDAAKKDSLFLKGVEAAERSMSMHPGFRKVFQETKDEKKAVLQLGPESIESIYWYSANLGKWASTKGMIVRLGNKGKLEAFNRRVLDLDEKFFHGAPHRFFGALPTKVPGGDLKESRLHFEKALAIEPNYFGTRTLYAELYATKAQDKATYLKQLDYVLATPASSLPDAEPENRYEQGLAKKLKEQANEFFE